MKTITNFVLAGLLVLVLPAALKAQDNNQETNETAVSASDYRGQSLVGGTMPFYFHYENQTWYNELAYMAMIGTPKNNLLIGYGESGDIYTDHVTGNRAYETQIFHASLQLSGDATIWDRFLRLPLHVYVPIRFHSGYNRLMFDGQYAGNDDNAARSTKNFLNANLGAGLGASYDLTVLDRIPILGSDFSFDAVYTRNPGVMIRFINDDDDPFDNDNGNEVGAAVSSEFLLMARVHRFLEANIGLSAGMRFSKLNWSAGPYEFSELFSAVVGDDIPPNEMNYSGFFLGITW